MHFAVIVSCEEITHSYLRRGNMRHEWSNIIAFITERLLWLKCMETVHIREVASDYTRHIAEINGFV
jgi:hypothetical protein